MGLIRWYEWKLVSEDETWSLALESNIQKVKFVFSKDKSVPGADVVLVEQEEMEATWDWVGAEFPEDGCRIKASNALYCSGEKLTTSWDS